MKFSIKYKFLIGLLIIFCISFNLLSFFLNKVSFKNNEKVIAAELYDKQRDIYFYLTSYIKLNKLDVKEDNIKIQAQSIALQVSSKLESRVSIYDSKGEFLFDTEYGDEKSNDTYTEEVDKLNKTAKKNKSLYGIIKDGDKYKAVFAGSLYLDNKFIGIISFSKDYTNLFNWSSELLNNIKLFMIVVFIVTFLLSIVLASSIINPIKKLSERTKEIALGNYSPIHINTTDEVGELSQNFNFMQDKIKQQIKTIEKDRDNLLKLQKHRKYFFDNATHEMKTPLTIISGYTQMLMDEGREDEKIFKKTTMRIKKEADKMHSMVVELLDMSKIQSSISYDKNINLSVLMGSVCEDMKLKASKYDIKIESNLKRDIYVYGSTDEIRRMIINILDNSIKYGKLKSCVQVLLTKANNQALVTIKDRGKGIAKEELNKIFQPFYRANKNMPRNREGNGLGLAIVKDIVDKHHGTIDINSKLNEGTEVIIKIPLKCSKV